MSETAKKTRSWTLRQKREAFTHLVFGNPAFATKEQPINLRPKRPTFLNSEMGRILCSAIRPSPAKNNPNQFTPRNPVPRNGAHSILSNR